MRNDPHHRPVDDSRIPFGDWKLRLVDACRRLRQRSAPPGSRREAFLRAGFRAVRGAIGTILTIPSRTVSRLRAFIGRFLPGARHAVLAVVPVAAPPPHERHRESVDLVVCVHNALDDVQRCLESVVRSTLPPCRLILVDDGSAPETARYLASFAASQDATLIRNDEARGYTRAANQGLRESRADFVVLLNSDTIVTYGWLDRLVACARRDRRVGLVGPLSNTASWQSVPQIFDAGGDWARNDLPAGFDPERLADLVAGNSARVHPRIPFLNGFCLLVRRAVLDTVGALDEATFPFGYGEENDLCLRARQAGFTLAVADDAYVFHAQSRSYSDERRRTLAAATDRALAAKHGAAKVSRGAEACRNDPVLHAARTRLHAALERAPWLDHITREWEARRLLFALPEDADQRLCERAFLLAGALADIGVDVRATVPERLRALVTWALPDPSFPVLWTEEATVAGGDGCDAIVTLDLLNSAGAAVDLSLFRPRLRTEDGSPRQPLRVAAGLGRHCVDRDAAAATVRLLGDLVRRRGISVETVFFDDDPADPLLGSAAAAFEWRHTLPLSLAQRAAFLGGVDVLVQGDCSAAAVQVTLEAMACGAAAVGPAAAALDPGDGVPHGELHRCLTTPTSASLETLIDDPGLLATVRLQAISLACDRSVEAATARLLTALRDRFPEGA